MSVRASREQALLNAREAGDAKQANVLMIADDAALSGRCSCAMSILAQGKERRIATWHKTSTPESELTGDWAHFGWKDKRGVPIHVNADEIYEEYARGSYAPATDALVKKAIQWLRKQHATIASSGSFDRDISYREAFEVVNVYTGEQESEEFFLRNFTVQEERLIFDEFMRQRAF